VLRAAFSRERLQYAFGEGLPVEFLGNATAALFTQLGGIFRVGQECVDGIGEGRGIFWIYE
jgi:hypothetical protein